MPKWILEPSHSMAEFNVRHMMITWVHGIFTKVSGTLIFDPREVAAASVEAVIDSASIVTGDTRRDDHLKGPDFLDVEQYPTIAFKSNRVEPAGLDHAWVHGDLSLHGVTRPVLLDVRWAGPARFIDEGRIFTSYGFRAETKINREDFGMTWNTDMEQGGVMVGRQVYLILNSEVNLVD